MNDILRISDDSTACKNSTMMFAIQRTTMVSEDVVNCHNNAILHRNRLGFQHPEMGPLGRADTSDDLVVLQPSKQSTQSGH